MRTGYFATNFNAMHMKQIQMDLEGLVTERKRARDK
jgi:hypothetical protein